MKARIVALLLSAAAVFGLTLGSASPASADTVTRYATVCVNANSTLRAHSSVSAWWYDGSKWVLESSASSAATGCGTVAIRHNGYFFLQAYAYAQVPCAIYRYFARTGTGLKQNQAVRFGVTLTPTYYDAVPLYC